MSDSVVRRILPVLIGITLTIVLLIALAYLSHQRRNIPYVAAPLLTVLQPRAGENVDSPLVIRFATEAPLSLHSTGWGAGNLHLHAVINGVEHMPAAAEITRVGSASYRWLLPAATRGPASFHLGWADQRHRPLRAGASDTIAVVVR